MRKYSEAITDLPNTLSISLKDEFFKPWFYEVAHKEDNIPSISSSSISISIYILSCIMPKHPQ